MTTLFIVALSIILVFAVYTMAAPLALNLSRFAFAFHVPCPECTLEADVKVGAIRAAVGTAYGEGIKALRVRRCSLLPPGETCAGACLKQIAA
jgi:hypothetical protein